jgi:hypothetical protein
MINDRWLTSEWPFVRTHLPPSSSRVVEIGCGPTGGFVPRLRSAGYDAVGATPLHPKGRTTGRILSKPVSLTRRWMRSSHVHACTMSPT